MQSRKAVRNRVTIRSFGASLRISQERMKRIRGTIVCLTLAVSGLSALRTLADTSPLQLTIQNQDGDVHLQWPSQAGDRFQIEHRTNLQAGTWQALSTNWPEISLRIGEV